MSKELSIQAANRLAETIHNMPEDKRLAYCIVALSTLAANRPADLLTILDIADMRIADGRRDKPNLALAPEDGAQPEAVEHSTPDECPYWYDYCRCGERDVAPEAVKE